jgi:hypothetical protein
MLGGGAEGYRRSFAQLRKEVSMLHLADQKTKRQPKVGLYVLLRMCCALAARGFLPLGFLCTIAFVYLFLPAFIEKKFFRMDDAKMAWLCIDQLGSGFLRR